MTASLPVTIPDAEVAALCQRFQVRELRLFGSVLRDDFRPDSDIDVLVELEPNAGIGLFAFFDLQDELTRLLGRPVDLVSKRGLHRVIRDNVLASSRVIWTPVYD